MNLKSYATLIAFFVIGISNMAQAADKVGNGGVSIVCRDSSSQITKASLLDLFEAENSGKTINRSDRPAEEQLNSFLSLIEEGIAYEIRRQIRILKSHATYISNPNVGMPLTDDTLPRLREKGCNYEQLGTYYDEGILKIDQEILGAPVFSQTDIAALWLHEALYKMDRDNNGAKTSIRTRDLIAILFDADHTQSQFQLFNKIFAKYMSVENTVWLDADINIEVVFKTSFPINSQCSIGQLVGPLVSDASPFLSHVVIYADEQHKNFSNWNGNIYRPLSDCWIPQVQSGQTFLEFYQLGRLLVTMHFQNYENVGGTLFSAKDVKVLFPDGRQNKYLIWRLL